jgi:hypothetical protein
MYYMYWLKQVQLGIALTRHEKMFTFIDVTCHDQYESFFLAIPFRYYVFFWLSDICL